MLVEDRGGPQSVGFRPNFHDVSISRENARLTKFPATELYHGPLPQLGGGSLLHESSDLKPVQCCGHGDSRETR